MDLYTYYRSSAAYRVRIVLELKGLACRHIPVHLLRDGGEQHGADYRAVNPQARIPSLRTDDGNVLVQSPAIIEYLEERYPAPALLPRDLEARARHRAVAAIIGCDIHPVHNLSVLNRLRALGHDEQAVLDWISHWMAQGLKAVEALIGDKGFCFETLGLADVYLLPQVYSARRFEVDLAPYPRIRRVEALALELDAFRKAHPDVQPDCPDVKGAA
ncbi:maleylacetoacetate isomerase [Pseudomonas sp. Marseille-QA0892]